MRSDTFLRFISLVIAMLAMTITIAVAVGEFASYSQILDAIPPTALILFGLLSVTISLWVLQRTLSSRAPLAYNVAIVGFPKSGKTTLITALFGEIFAHRVRGIDASLSGRSTIDRVNRDLALIQQGESLGPTTDQDLFAYRTNVRLGNQVFPRSYKIEFGDFPGEDSIAYSEQYGDWLHSTPFFKWVVDADALIFVIDLGEYQLAHLANPSARNQYAVRMSSAIRAAWQHILDANRDKEREVRRRPVVLVMNKADLLATAVVSSSQPGSELYREKLRDKILALGFGHQTPEVRELKPEVLESSSPRVLAEFDDLILFFRGESKRFSTVFTSSFRTIDSRLLGGEDLLKLVLPPVQLMPL